MSAEQRDIGQSTMVLSELYGNRPGNPIPEGTLDFSPGTLTKESTEILVSSVRQSVGYIKDLVNKDPDRAIKVSTALLITSIAALSLTHPAEAKALTETLNHTLTSVNEASNLIGGAIGGVVGFLKEAKDGGVSSDNADQLFFNTAAGIVIGYSATDLFLIYKNPEITLTRGQFVKADVEKVLLIPAIWTVWKTTKGLGEKLAPVIGTPEEIFGKRFDPAEAEINKLVRDTRSSNIKTSSHARAELENLGYRRDRKTGKWIG